MIENPAFTIGVTVGHATVHYCIKSKKVENGFEKHIITLKSAFSLDKGILGYSFTYAGQPFTAAFPGVIERGRRKYPPFFTRAGANVHVQVVNGESAEVYAILKSNWY